MQQRTQRDDKNLMGEMQIREPLGPTASCRLAVIKPAENDGSRQSGATGLANLWVFFFWGRAIARRLKKTSSHLLVQLGAHP